MVNPQNPYEAPQASTARSEFSPGAGQSRDFGIWEVIGLGFAAVRRQPVELVGGFFLTMLVSLLVQSLPSLLTLTGLVPPGLSVATFGVMGVGMLLSYLCNAYLLVGQARVAIAAARGEEVELSHFFSGGDRVGIMFLLSLVEAFAVGFACLLLIVPGVILALGWMLASFFVADSDCDIGEALSESWAVTRGQRGKLFLFALTSVFVAFLGVCALGLGLFVALPALMVALGTIYVRMTGNTESPAAAP